MLVFFGAGKIGRRMLSIWTGCGFQVDYFVDNNHELIGKNVEGIEVISIEKAKKLSKDITIFITCKDSDMVFSQLVKAGICSKQIVMCNLTACMLNRLFALPELILPVEVSAYGLKKQVPDIMFDLSMGLTLGGVETWSVQTAQKLERMGKSTALLVNSKLSTEQEKGHSRTISVSFESNKSEWKILDRLLKVIVGVNCTNLVCNFMSYIFSAACLAKKIYPAHVNMIVVVHSDSELYYQNCILMKQYIDKCLVISEKMKSELIKRGFPQKKIRYLPWEITCDKTFHHIYSTNEEKIRVGYAGRIVTEAKRIDYIVPLAKMLKKRGIQFVLELAGRGIYETRLKDEIEKNELQEEVVLLGMIEHSEIRSFWQRQDIMISCSEYEGHCITQCEAMANGVIPIITDVSGARDDIQDGANGFVIEIGALDQMAERICFLYEHRKLLPKMGKKAYTTIKEKYSEERAEQLWKEVLKD